MRIREKTVRRREKTCFGKYWVIFGFSKVDQYDTRWHCINAYKALCFYLSVSKK